MTERFLVLHDYGMGGLWWWVRARSAREIVETFAEVEVVDDPEIRARFDDEQLEETDVGAAVLPIGLQGLRETRDAQRGKPGFGALAGRERVWIRRHWAEDDVTYFEELGPDGRRIRQVDVHADGTAVGSTEDDWPFNPPNDLFDPDLAPHEISAAEFEEAWHRAGVTGRSG